MAARAFASEVARATALSPHTRKGARFRPRVLPVAGSVSDSAIDSESDNARVSTLVRHRVRGLPSYLSAPR